MSGMTYVFGPVASRRLGRSLGVDLVPFKTCSFDCVFCECGGTTSHTVVRKEYVPAKAVSAEIEAWCGMGGSADYITIAGSGEPTLHSRFGDIIRAIKKVTQIPVCLLTNGSLLHLPEVRADASCADVVIPSLNAADERTFNRVCRPCRLCTFAQHIEGLRVFAAEYRGSLWLEVFIVPGMNDSAESIKAIAELAKGLAPRRIQLNTAVRPPAVGSIRAASRPELEELAPRFTPKAEVIASFPGSASPGSASSIGAVRQMLERRPCTTADVAHGLGITAEDARRHIEELRSTGVLNTELRGEAVYYSARRG